MGDNDVLSPPASGRAPTIYDVALAAGVTSSTVSRAFSRPGRVSVDTAARIHRIADELGYHVKPRAWAPAPGATSMLALVVADGTNSFFLQIMRSAQETAARTGHLLLLVDAQESMGRERDAIERLIPVVDGLILATSRMSDAAIRNAARQRPIVLLNRPMTDVPSLVVDNAGGMRAAIEHLAGLGHRTVTYAAGPEASWADGMRWHAARKSAADYGLRARRIGPFPPTLAGGRAAASAFGEKPTTSVIGYNDLMSIGLMRELTRQGASVPDDVSIIGFDNISDAAVSSPSLTTVAAPLDLLGQAAVETLLAQTTSRSAVAARTAMLPADLVIRSSTGPRGSGTL